MKGRGLSGRFLDLPLSLAVNLKQPPRPKKTFKNINKSAFVFQEKNYDFKFSKNSRRSEVSE